jgi:toxin ParE1/3/4
MSSPWRVRLANAAQDDFAGILRWTVENFSQTQARTYAKTLRGALGDLAQGPDIAECRTRDDIGPGIHTLHVARKGRKGRHFVVFRVDAPANTIDVLRLLHDSMGLPRHLATSQDE